MDNSEISENHLKAIAGWLQVIGVVEFRQVPIYRQGNPGRRKSDEKWRSRLAVGGGECQPGPPDADDPAGLLAGIPLRRDRGPQRGGCYRSAGHSVPADKLVPVPANSFEKARIG